MRVQVSVAVYDCDIDTNCSQCAIILPCLVHPWPNLVTDIIFELAAFFGAVTGTYVNYTIVAPLHFWCCGSPNSDDGRIEETQFIP